MMRMVDARETIEIHLGHCSGLQGTCQHLLHGEQLMFFNCIAFLVIDMYFVVP